MRDESPGSAEAAPDFRGLASRVDALERSNRRMKWAVALLLSVIGLTAFLGLAPRKDKVMVADAFTLLGATGEPRAVLTLIDGEPTLAFFDTKGKVRAGISVGKGAPWIAFYDETGKAIWKAP